MTTSTHLRRITRQALRAADVPVDSCSAVSGHGYPLVIGARCHANFGGKHAAGRAVTE